MAKLPPIRAVEFKAPHPMLRGNVDRRDRIDLGNTAYRDYAIDPVVNDMTNRIDGVLISDAAREGAGHHYVPIEEVKFIHFGALELEPAKEG